MSTETVTQTVSELKLTPPDPVPTVAPQQAMGLVPVTDEQKSKLEERVEAYVADLIAQDVNSPEFGKRVDQLTNMGRKEIMEASAQSTRLVPDRRACASPGDVHALPRTPVSLSAPLPRRSRHRGSAARNGRR